MINKKKMYVKVKVPGGKKEYHAILGKTISKRSFKTATLAEAYAQAWHDRYISLKIASIRVKEKE